MIKARIAFNLNSPTSYPVQNPCSPINRLSLRFSPAEAFPHRLRRIQISFCAGKSFSSPHEDDFARSEIMVPSGSRIWNPRFIAFKASIAMYAPAGLLKL